MLPVCLHTFYTQHASRMSSHIFWIIKEIGLESVGRECVVGIATCYGLDGSGIKSRWG
jgi:hypothetical protein